MKVEKIDIEIRDALAKIFIKLGIRDMDATVLAELIKDGKDMCVDKLSKKLNYSISGTTSSLHRLMKMHLVGRTKRGKKYIYKSESNLLSTLLHLIEDIHRHEIQKLLEKIDFSLKVSPDKNLESFREKVETADRYLSMISKLLREYSGGEENAYSFDI